MHRGETFVIAGDRFAIGSSREMSPAGLKAIADEAGLEMVIVCGNNMGDIFRRNALNLGLQVVQSPEAVADARDGDEFSFDPSSRRLDERHAGQDLRPGAAQRRRKTRSARRGGIYAAGRREFKALGRERRRAIDWPDAEQARRMTSTEQIVWAHRVDTAAGGHARARRCASTPICCRRRTARRRSRSTRSTRSPAATRSFRARRRSPTTTSCSPARTTTTSRRRSGREFARLHGIEKPYYATPGDGIFHFYFPEQALVMPGQFIPGADSHSRAYGAYGAVGMGVGSTTLGFGWSTGYIYFTVAKARRVDLRRPASVVGQRQGHRARAAAALGREAVAGDVGGARRREQAAADRLSQHDREHDGRGGGAQRHLRARRHRPTRGIARRASPSCRIRRSRRAPMRATRSTRPSICDDVMPMIAKPFSPGNAFPADEVARERITFDKAMIGSCTNGSYDDLLAAALVRPRRARRRRRRRSNGVRRVSGIGRRRPADRAAGPRGSTASRSPSVFRSVGGQIRQSWCGPCFGQGPDALDAGQRAITSFNRNWQNRMGLGGEGYLASPVVVAASALIGYMAPPGELGLKWNPEEFGV